MLGMNGSLLKIAKSCRSENLEYCTIFTFNSTQIGNKQLKKECNGEAVCTAAHRSAGWQPHSDMAWLTRFSVITARQFFVVKSVI